MANGISRLVNAELAKKSGRISGEEMLREIEKAANTLPKEQPLKANKRK